MKRATDEVLLERFRTGDPRAFTALYERYKGALYGFCFRMIPDRSLAEDAVHETFLKLHTQAWRITEDKALRSWLYRVARNETLMILRQKRDGPPVETDTVWDLETPQVLMEAKDTHDAVDTVLSRLKAEYREVILLREFDGLSYAEIASITGDSESSVKARLFKARKALAERLAPWWKERNAL